MAFPQLLRRSSFATHDPLITRVYTATPSSIARHGDWGLKYPIHRKKGPRYIRLSTLDAGKVIGADWRSAEREARFVQSWGDGKVAWQRASPGIASGASRQVPSSLEGDTRPVRPRKGAETYVPNIESMTEEEFERFLDTVRKEKGATLDRKLTTLKNALEEKEKWTEEQGDFTLVKLAVKGHGHETDAAEVMARITKDRLTAPKSTVLLSHPHPLGGLTYSSSTKSAPSINTDSTTAATSNTPLASETTFPGRAVDRQDRTSFIYDRSRGIAASSTNHPFIVASGGLTGMYRRSLEARVTDVTDLEVTDYTQTHPDDGKGRFRVQSALLRSDPTVLGLNSANLEERYEVPHSLYRFDGRVGRSRPVSRAAAPKPLDTFEHDISFGFAGAESSDAATVPGSAEYVATPPPSKTRLSRGDYLARGVPSAGGPRVERKPGQALYEAQKQAWDNNRNVASGLVGNITRTGGAQGARPWQMRPGQGGQAGQTGQGVRGPQRESAYRERRAAEKRVQSGGQ